MGLDFSAHEWSFIACYQPQGLAMIFLPAFSLT